MKYLKSINELLNISKDEFEEIKDIFQDLVDEFDLEETENDVVETPGLYYRFDNTTHSNYLVLFIIIGCSDDFEFPLMLDFDDYINKFKLVHRKLSDFKKRMYNSGYIVEYVELEHAISEVIRYNDFSIQIRQAT